MLLSCNNYLYNCDFIYKYKVKNLHNILKISSLKLVVQLSELKKELEPVSIVDISDSHLQTNAFFLFYLNFVFIPYITFDKKYENFYQLKFVVSKNKIKSFLFKFFNTIYFFFSNFLLESKNFNNFFLKLNLLKYNQSNFFIKQIFPVSGLKNLSTTLNFKINT